MTLLQFWRWMMAGSCCGGSTKPAKVAMTTAQEATEVAAEQPAAKDECRNDEPAKSEKHGCGC
jgi:hypothetical protein